MVGLVLVSHSRPLASALESMLRKFYDEALPVAVAAGAGENGSELGTDATDILAAIESVCGAEGAVVLLDIGSAILSTELALDLLDETLRKRVAICAAPLVEGAIAAGAQVKIGSPLDVVRAEAEKALHQKVHHLAKKICDHAAAPDNSRDQEHDAQVRLHIETAHGLHARPAMRIVEMAAGFKSEIRIRNLRTQSAPASALSLVAINCLDARHGDEIEVTARGPDVDEALAAFVALHGKNFGDRPEVSSQKAERASKQGPDLSGDQYFLGEPLSRGRVHAPVAFGEREALVLPQESGTIETQEERARLAGAMDAVREHLDADIASLKASIGEEGADILAAHRMLLDDPSLGRRALDLIEQENLSALQAWDVTVRETIKSYQSLGDPVLRERARDIEDFSLQIFSALGLGARLQTPQLETPVILVVPSLLPGDVAQLDLTKIRGVIAESMGPTSHAAILLRSAGIPAVDGVPFLRLRNARHAMLNGSTGEIWIDPEPGQIAAQEKASSERKSSGPRLPLHTADGTRIELAANVAGEEEAAAAIADGAEAIGLLRTEFLFLDRSEAPHENEQIEKLQKILEAFPKHLPVTIRTLDIGGDKPAPYLPVPAEANPFLGVRGIRLTLKRKALFQTHLRAILQAAVGRPARIMFPMVTNPEEFLTAKELTQEAHEGLVKADRAHAWPVEIGMMVEVPAAAINARAFAGVVDFFSIGTNDLTQYTLAAERGHSQLRDFSSALHPAVLRLVGLVARAARAHGKWAGVCGEAAADPVAARAFVGLGITELSVGAQALEGIYDTISSASLPECRREAGELLRAMSSG